MHNVPDSDNPMPESSSLVNASKGGMNFESKLLIYIGGAFGGFVLILVVVIFIKRRLEKTKDDHFRRPYDEN